MLEIRNLVKVYPGPVAALQGVSLKASRGMLGLLGPNGAGKTTLLRIVAGLLEPTSGTVLLDGEDVTTDPRRIHRQLGYLPQDFGFYPHLTGAAMLRFLLVLKGVKAPQGVTRLAAELLERVNLQDAAKRKVGTYSGGEEVEGFVSARANACPVEPCRDEEEHYQLFLRNQLEFDIWRNSQS